MSSRKKLTIRDFLRRNAGSLSPNRASKSSSKIIKKPEAASTSSIDEPVTRRSSFASSNSSESVWEARPHQPKSSEEPTASSSTKVVYAEIHKSSSNETPSISSHTYDEIKTTSKVSKAAPSGSSHVYEEMEPRFLNDQPLPEDVETSETTYMNPLFHDNSQDDRPTTSMTVLLYGGYQIPDSKTGSTKGIMSVLIETSSLYRLDLRNGRMETVTDKFIRPPTGRTRQAAAVLLDDDIYIVGGLESELSSMTKATPSASSWRLRGVEDGSPSWTKIADLNSARVHHTLIVHRGRLMAIGGLGHHDRILDSIEVYEPGRNQWRQLKSTIPQPCLGMAACIYRGLIWFLGGITPCLDSDGKRSKQGRVSRTVYVFNDTLNAWYWAAPLRSPRVFARAVIARNTLQIVGGIGWASFMFGFQTVDSLDMVNNKWQPDSNMRNTRHHFALVKRGDDLYVIGGVSADTENELKSIEKLDLTTSKWSTMEYALPIPFAGTECT